MWKQEGGLGTKAMALKQFLFICSSHKILSGRSKINKTDKTTQYESKVGCWRSSLPAPAPPSSPSQTVGISRVPKARFESAVLNDLQGHFLGLVPNGFPLRILPLFLGRYFMSHNLR